MSVINLIDEFEKNNTFQKVITQNYAAKNAWNYLKRNPKLFATIIIIGSIFSIFLFGYDIGEFLYYITH